jgi:DNA primase
VSTPVTWHEVEVALDTEDAGQLEFEIDAVLARVAESGDLYAGGLAPEQELPRLG